MGKLLAICTSPKRGTVKTEVPSAVLTPEWGIVEDCLLYTSPSPRD